MRALGFSMALLLLAAPVGAGLPLLDDGAELLDAPGVAALASPVQPGRTYRGTLSDVVDASDHYRIDVDGPAIVRVELVASRLVSPTLTGDQQQRWERSLGDTRYLSANVHAAGSVLLHLAYATHYGTGGIGIPYAFVATVERHEHGARSCAALDAFTIAATFEEGRSARLEIVSSFAGGPVRSSAFAASARFESEHEYLYSAQVGGTRNGYGEPVVVARSDPLPELVLEPPMTVDAGPLLSLSMRIEHGAVAHPLTPARAWYGVAGEGMQRCISAVWDGASLPYGDVEGTQATYMRARSMEGSLVQAGPYTSAEHVQAGVTLLPTMALVLAQNHPVHPSGASPTLEVTPPSGEPWTARPEDFRVWSAWSPDIRTGGAWGASLRDVEGLDMDTAHVAAFSFPIPLPPIPR